MFTREKFEALDDADLSDVRGLINDVYQKRMDAKNASDEITRNLQILQEQNRIVHADGEPWVQPTGAHDVYGLNAVTTHKGGRWRSNHPYNSWEPGTADLWEWMGEDEDHTPQETEPESDTGVEVWAPDVSYPAGKVVTHEGATYECTMAHRSQPDWAPDLVPALWKKVG